MAQVLLYVVNDLLWKYSHAVLSADLSDYYCYLIPLAIISTKSKNSNECILEQQSAIYLEITTWWIDSARSIFTSRFCVTKIPYM